MKLRKNEWIWIALVVVLTLLIAGCGGKNKPSNGQSAANSESENKQTVLAKELNIFNWSEYLPQSIIDKFEAEYGVKVNYNTFSSNEEMLAKITAGATYDISVVSDYMVSVMVKQNLLEPIDLSNIPNIKNVDSDFRNQPYDPDNKFTVPYMWGTIAIGVNTDKVKTPVESYADLFRPEFKNSLVVLDDSRSMIGFMNMLQGKSINETDPDVLEKSKQKLIELLPNIKAFDSDSPKTMMINGEASAGIMWGAEVSLARRENPAIETVYPKEGTNIWVDNFVIPKGAPHKKTAEVFINFILRPEISAEISKEFPYANPNEAAHKFIDKEILEDPAVYPPAEVLAKGQYLKDIGKATTLYDRIWSEVKSH